MKKIDVGLILMYTALGIFLAVVICLNVFFYHSVVKAYHYIEETHQAVYDHKLDLNGNKALIQALDEQIQHLTDRTISLALEYEELQEVIHKEWTGIVNSKETLPIRHDGKILRITPSPMPDMPVK